MSDMKCPMCNTNLEVLVGGANALLGCPRCRDKATDGVWQELIRTRKALDVAKDTIRHADWFFDGDYNVDAKTMHSEIKCAIKGITALEQKDK